MSGEGSGQKKSGDPVDKGSTGTTVRLSAEALRSPQFLMRKDNLLEKINRALSHDVEDMNENEKRWSMISADFLPVLNTLASSRAINKSRIKAVRNWLLKKENRKNQRTTGKMFLLHLRGKMIDPRTGKIVRRHDAPVKSVDRMNCLYVLNELFQWDKQRALKREEKEKDTERPPRAEGGDTAAAKGSRDYRSRWKHLILDFLVECGKGLDRKLMSDFRRVLSIWYDKDLLEESLLTTIRGKFCGPVPNTESAGAGSKRKQTSQPPSGAGPSGESRPSGARSRRPPPPPSAPPPPIKGGNGDRQNGRPRTYGNEMSRNGLHDSRRNYDNVHRKNRNGAPDRSRQKRQKVEKGRAV